MFAIKISGPIIRVERCQRVLVVVCKQQLKCVCTSVLCFTFIYCGRFIDCTFGILIIKVLLYSFLDTFRDYKVQSVSLFYN